jgi:exosome complex component RRP43
MVAALKNSQCCPALPFIFFLLKSRLIATLPKAVYNPDTHQTMCYRKAPRVPLQLSSCVPISASFGIFDSFVLSHPCCLYFSTTDFPRKLIFADPTSFEEPLLNTTISVVLENDNHIMLVSQLGPAMLSIDDEEEGEKRDALPECIERAKRRRKGLVGTLFW